jgi:hypothetical protein
MYADVELDMEKALKDQTVCFNCMVSNNLLFAFDDIAKLRTVPQTHREAFLERIHCFEIGVRLVVERVHGSASMRLLPSVVEHGRAVLQVNLYQEMAVWHHGVGVFEGVREDVEKIGEPLWVEGERRVADLVAGGPLDDFTVDAFPKVLDVTSTVPDYGRRVVDCPGDVLGVPFNSLAEQYSTQFHRGSITRI